MSENAVRTSDIPATDPQPESYQEKTSEKNQSKGHFKQ